MGQKEQVRFMIVLFTSDDLLCQASALGSWPFEPLKQIENATRTIRFHGTLSASETRAGRPCTAPLFRPNCFQTSVHNSTPHLSSGPELRPREACPINVRSEAATKPTTDTRIIHEHDRCGHQSFATSLHGDRKLAHIQLQNWLYKRNGSHVPPKFLHPSATVLYSIGCLATPGAGQEE